MCDPMENGASHHSCETEAVWERAWPLEEMRKSSTNWSLAADSGLLLFLQDFSHRMLSKTHDIEKQLDGLIRDTKATDSRLHTVFNDFLMLSNTQFIENRVYDEEVEEPVPKPEVQERPPEQEKTREQKEAELIPKVQEAVNFGLRVLESAFEQLDIKAGNSDSEDEEAADRVEPILEPKDLYADRPLPYLIGSQAFMDQDDVGLGDLSSDDMSIDSERDSVIESEEDRNGDHSDEDYDQDEEGQSNLKKKSSMLGYEEEEEEDGDDEDSDIFGESDREDDEDIQNPAGPSSFADELAARIKGEPGPKSEADRESLSSGPPAARKKTKGKKEAKPQEDDDNDDLFKPPEMEDEDFSPFGGKGGLFSGGRGLFDDDDEGDLFSEAPKSEPEKTEKKVTQTTEPVKSKKVPSGAVSVFPDNSLFGSPNDSDSLKSTERESPGQAKVQPAPKQTSGVGGGLFDDDEEDDDFFSGRGVKKSSSAVMQEKAKPKKTVDLFGGDEDDDEDGDIFSGSSSGAPHPQPQQSNREVQEEVSQPPPKKMPAGAVSIFGPGTKNVLVEGLKKRQPSTSDEPEKSGEPIPPPNVVKAPIATKPEEKALSRGLFSDDEDSQIFPTMTKSQSKPEPSTQIKPSRPGLSLFDDDDEEEDLFASGSKSKSIQVKKPTMQAKKPVSSVLFSDEEDQWMSTKPSPVKQEGPKSGMKPSTSAPSSLPSVKAPPKSSLFSDGDDDLFAATKEPNQKKPQRVSLLFEDEAGHDDKGTLFGSKPPASNPPPEVKVPAAVSPVPSEVDGAKAVQVESAQEERSPEEPPPDTEHSPEEDPGSKRKPPAGAVSLFGGIDVLGHRQDSAKKTTKSPLDGSDAEDDFSGETPPPMGGKEPKSKKTTLSLFDNNDDDDEEGEDEEADSTAPTSTVAKPTAKYVQKEPTARTKSTGVFQDEELLFSRTQQRDNDPDVDLFAPASKPAAPLPGSVKPGAPALFGGDDDEDDLFSATKPKMPPKVQEKPSRPLREDDVVKSAVTTASPDNEKPASTVKSKEPSTRIGKLQANLSINPASLLPGAVAPRLPGAVSVMPSLATPSVTTPTEQLPTSTATTVTSEGGVNFDTPVQVTTLQSTNKGRAKGAVRRRPQTRGARQLAAQLSEESNGRSQSESPANAAPPCADPDPPPPPPSDPILPRPSDLPLPVTTSTHQEPAVQQMAGKEAAPPADEEDLFGSDDLFASTFAPKQAATVKPKLKTTAESSSVSSATVKKKEVTPSIFDDHGGDLFQRGKQKPAKKAKAMPFLEDDDEDYDIFGMGKNGNAVTSKDAKTGSSLAKQAPLQDELDAPPKAKAAKKPADRSQEVSLFDDNVDIFADLTAPSKPKEKAAKKKVDTRSIFDDDMDDIFSAAKAKPVVKPPAKSKTPQRTQGPSSVDGDSHDLFDDPLNVLGGN